jgi:hypothetical protein
MKIGTVTKTVVSKGSKQKFCIQTKRMRETQMVIYKTFMGSIGWLSRTRHELV